MTVQDAAGPGPSSDDLARRQQEIDADLRRREIRAGVWKVALGTCIVGIAAALFPAVQQASSYYFDYLAAVDKLELERQRLELEGQQVGSTLQAEDRRFLESLAKEGRSKNLDERIVLAEYYVYLAEESDEQERWRGFLEHLYAIRDQKREAVIEAARAAVAADADPAAVAEAQAKARLYSESAAGGAEVGGAVGDTFETLVDQLSSDDSGTRRDARAELAALGLGLVRPAMSLLAEGGLSYRERLGLVVALTEMMRANKAQRAGIAQLLELPDLEAMLVAGTDTDRTLRIHAGEFLYDLGDPRVFEAVPSIWEETPSDNGRFNLALALKGAAPYVPAGEAARAQSVIRGFLGEVGPRTDGLLEDALSLLPGA